jgi:hypothetical protein
MNQNPAEIEKLSPQKLLANFTQSRFAVWVAAALVIHVIVIGGMSFGFIRDTWIDPEGAANRKAAAEAVAKAEAEKLLKQLAPAPVTNAPPATVATNAPAAPATTNAEASLLDQRRNTPVVKAITEVAPTNDIPKVPDDLGIGIKDMNVR